MVDIIARVEGLSGRIRLGRHHSQDDGQDKDDIIENWGNEMHAAASLEI